MNGTELINVAGYVLALAGGFALGVLFGQKLVADIQAMVHALELRVVAIESVFSKSAPTNTHSAAVIAPAAAATAKTK